MRTLMMVFISLFVAFSVFHFISTGAIPVDLPFLRNLMGNREMISPLEHFRISSPFGFRDDPFGGGRTMHNGIDLVAPAGTPVFAVADGVVILSEFDALAGWFVRIRHSRLELLSSYLHMLETPLVSVGQTVTKGTHIGFVGSTGQSTGPHLCFRIQDLNSNFKNPENFIPFSSPALLVPWVYRVGGTIP